MRDAPWPVKVLLAVLTFGLYPIIPIALRWQRRWIFNMDVRQAQYRAAVRREARRRNQW